MWLLLTYFLYTWLILAGIFGLLIAFIWDECVAQVQQEWKKEGNEDELPYAVMLISVCLVVLFVGPIILINHLPELFK